MIDTHRHILPGLDDGTQTLAEAVECSKIAEDKGIKQIIATPHSDGIYLTNIKIIDSCEALNKELIKENISLRILPGAEIKLNNGIGQLLRDDKLMTINNNGRYILVECPDNLSPINLLYNLRQIKSLGVIPIIAHPERNPFLIMNKNLWNEIMRMEVLTQINAGSITGYFGKGAMRNAKQIIKEGYAYLIGSDCHGLRHKRPDLWETYDPIKKIAGEKVAQELIYENPQRLLQNVLMPAIKIKKGLLNRISQSIRGNY